MKNLFFFCVLTLLIQNTQAQHSIIPEPVNYQINGENFVLENQLIFNIVTTNKEAIKYVNQFKTFIENAGIKTLNEKSNEGNSLIINLNNNHDTELGEEGYTLNIKSHYITLSANQAAGIFNGLQTLKQMLPANFENPTHYKSGPVNITGCEIKDYPRFGWRGLMLDVSRHFFTVDEVKAYIDKMSHYKFNVFHWHLTDDNGWRIEIKSLPKLTEIGAWRVERHGKFGAFRKEPQEGEKTTYGGYYTQKEIKDVIKYAADRNITIVPEIDIPGHSMAALAA